MTLLPLTTSHAPDRPTRQPSPPLPSSFVIRHSSFPKAFSLVEVLLAIFILGIGMIMVASVFPVGANWTRQTTEDSVGQTVAQNAFSLIRRHYDLTSGDLRIGFAADFWDPSGIATNSFVPNNLNRNSVLKATVAASGFTPFTLQPLPGFNYIPANERAYQFGSSSPFPASNFRVCSYFWTALIRLNPAHQNTANLATNGIQPASSYKYDLYILVFRKGSADHTFAPSSSEPSALRDVIDQNGLVENDELRLPSLTYTTYAPGTYNSGNTPPVSNCTPPLGQIGIGSLSGTVFRQMVTNNFTGAMPRPALRGQSMNSAGATIPPVPTEPIIYSPPAIGTSASPLIYVYQTTLTF